MPKTLLLADDSVTIQKVVGISFASEDVTLLTVDNGDDAIARAREARPDLVLADVVMPGKNGYEVCEALKADPQLRHIPVVLLTGTFEAFDEERARRAGAAAHIAKPFEAQTLVDQVKQLLAAPPPAPPAPPPAPAAQPAAAPPQPAAARPQPAAAPPQPAAPPPQPAAAPPPAPAAAAPQPAPAPASSALPEASVSEESFDFFDDDLGDLSPPEPTVTAQPSDAGFAFGDEELSPPDTVAEPAPAPPLPIAPRPAASSAPAPQSLASNDRTVAILPDDGAPGGTMGEGDLTTLETSFDDGLGLTDPNDGDSLAPVDPTSATSGGGFDFDFEGETPPPASDGLDAGDLAQATVLDPDGASGYDVSSSDLGDPLGRGAADAAATPPPDLSISAPTAPPAPPPAAPAVRPPQPEPADAAPGRAAPPIPDFDTLDATAPPPRRETPPAPVEMPPPPPEPAPEPVAAAPAPAMDPGQAAQAALDAVGPQLREQVHEALEKIAWEAFSDVGEKIVEQVVERVEKVAWEVIPQMAETLIREEIRKLKGGS